MEGKKKNKAKAIRQRAERERERVNEVCLLDQCRVIAADRVTICAGYSYVSVILVSSLRERGGQR